MNSKFSVKTKKLISLSRDYAIDSDLDVIDSRCLLYAYFKVATPHRIKENLIKFQFDKISNYFNQVNAEYKLNLEKEEEKRKQSLIGKLSNLINREEKKEKLHVKIDKIRSIPLSKEAEKDLKVSFLVAKGMKEESIEPKHVILAMFRNSDLFKNLSIEEELKELVMSDPKLEFDNDAQKNNSTKSIDLIFHLDEFKPDEISEILMELNEIYTSLGGDQIVIKGMDVYEFDSCKNPVLV